MISKSFRVTLFYTNNILICPPFLYNIGVLYCQGVCVCVCVCYCFTQTHTFSICHPYYMGMPVTWECDMCKTLLPIVMYLSFYINYTSTFTLPLKTIVTLPGVSWMRKVTFKYSRVPSLPKPTNYFPKVIVCSFILSYKFVTIVFCAREHCICI